MSTIQSVQFGSLEDLQTALNNGDYVSLLSIDDPQVLEFAIQHGIYNDYQLAFVKALEEKNTPLIKVFVKYLHNWTFLDYANFSVNAFILALPYISRSAHWVLIRKLIQENRLPLVKILLDYMGPVVLQSEELSSAVQTGNPDLVRLILEHVSRIFIEHLQQANEDVLPILEGSPKLSIVDALYWAVIQKDKPKILQLVAHPDIFLGALPHAALTTRDLDILQAVIQRGVTPEDMFTRALFNDNYAVMKMLLDRWNVKLYEEDSQGNLLPQSLVFTIIGSRQEDVLKLVFDELPFRIIYELFNYSLSLNLSFFLERDIPIEEFPDMFLQYVNSQRYEGVQEFIRRGVDIHHNNEQALYLAVSKNNLELVKLLLQHGADPLVSNVYIDAQLQDSQDIIVVLEDYYDNLEEPLPKGFAFLKDTQQCLPESRFQLVSRDPHPGAVIGYGNRRAGYLCFDLAELLINFQQSEFRNPYNLNLVFTREDLRDIQYIVDHHPQDFSPELVDQYHVFMTRLQLDEERLTEEIQVLKDYEHPSDIRQLLVYFFSMGMYFRQWRGPGHPFPLEARRTGQELPQSSVAETHLLQVLTIIHQQYTQVLNRLPDNIRQTYESLPIIEIVAGEIYPMGETLGSLYEQVCGQGEACIRMASSPFVISGAYYLQQILGERIPGYHLSMTVDPIH